ncbi:MAG TPA: EFR1 family ferrodoxin [Chroococcales cyanobacterium]|jgi:ferredoxin
MKTTLYYFTGTGNSLKIAGDLAAFLGETEIVPIASLRQVTRIQADCERVGIISPLYFSGLPEIVLRFTERLAFTQRPQYLFAVINRGVDGMGGALGQLKKSLKRQKLTLDAGFYLQMPDNYLPVFDAPSPEAREKTFQQAERRLGAIAQAIQDGKRSLEREWFGFLFPFLYPRWLKKVHQADEHFSIDPGCIGCGLCAKVCPVDNIEMIEERPHWKHRCQECFACIHHCPKKVIQCCGKSRQRGRYRHPGISVQAIIAQKGGAE